MPIKPFNSRPYEASGTSFGGKCDPPSPKLETREKVICLSNRTNLVEMSRIGFCIIKTLLTPIDKWQS